jgi:hypothetical protein
MDFEKGLLDFHGYPEGKMGRSFRNIISELTSGRALSNILIHI